MAFYKNFKDGLKLRHNNECIIEINNKMDVLSFRQDNFNKRLIDIEKQQLIIRKFNFYSYYVYCVKYFEKLLDFVSKTIKID